MSQIALSAILCRFEIFKSILIEFFCFILTSDALSISSSFSAIHLCVDRALAHGFYKIKFLCFLIPFRNFIHKLPGFILIQPKCFSDNFMDTIICRLVLSPISLEYLESRFTACQFSFPMFDDLYAFNDMQGLI